MSERGGPEAEGASSRGAGSAGPGPAPGGGRSFKLRFAHEREAGRSYVSAVKPLGVPATVTGKFYAREETAAEGEERALAALRRLFARPPPPTEAHACGRWWREGAARAAAARRDPRLWHGLADSAWLKARVRVLAEPR